MFSEKQIKELIKNYAADGGFGGVDLKVKTIEQAEANWSLDVTSFPTTTNCTSEPIFCRIQQINQELHIVMLGKINNPTESDINIYSTQVIEVTLPEEIANKIYDVLGNKVSDTLASTARVSTNFASAYGNSEVRSDMSKFMSDVVMQVINAEGANKLLIMFSRPSTINLKAGKDTYLESRVSLDLI